MLAPSFVDSLLRLYDELKDVDGLGRMDSVIFGSSALAVRGIIDRTPDDIDVMVSRRVWGALLAHHEWTVDTPNAGDPPILTNSSVPHHLHLFYDWRDDAVDIDPYHLMATSDAVSSAFGWGLNFASVAEVLRHKEAAFAWREQYPKVWKHGPDILACRDHLGLPDGGYAAVMRNREAASDVV